MSKEEALLYQKALITSKNKQIKQLKKELYLAHLEIEALQLKFGTDYIELNERAKKKYLAAQVKRQSEYKIKYLADKAKQRQIKKQQRKVVQQ